MPTRPVARPAARLLAGAVACLVLVSGCGGTGSTSASSSPSGSSTGSSTASSTSTSSVSPSGAASSSSTPSTPSASPSSAASPRTLRARLLGAAELPGFNAGYRWRATGTAPESPSSSFGTCQRFSTTAIGAERAVVRRYLPAARSATGDKAGELVATFPDALTARRAFAVLTAWRSRCADRLRQHTRPHVGSLQDVSVPGGTAGWYLLTYGPVPGQPDAQVFDAQGMVMVGSRIAMVSLALAGQDYNYAAGHEPMVAALQRAARNLG